MMNWIWVMLIITSILCGAFTGNMHQVTLRSFQSAEAAVWLALKLIGIMAFWLGLMRVAEVGGLLAIVARWLRRPMRYLFPDIPENHPAMSAMIMNFGANMLGLANAATPFGIKAMIELNKLNRHPGSASNAMCLFLAINTSSLALLPTGTMGLRASAGSTDPASILLPSLLASMVATIIGITAVKLLRRMPRFKLDESGHLPPESLQIPTLFKSPEEDQTGSQPERPPPPTATPPSWPLRIFTWSVIAAFVSAAIYHYGFKAEKMGPLDIAKDIFSSWMIPALMGAILLFGLSKKVKVYEVLVEGAKEGFQVAIRIIPYLVAIMVAVAMFEASGAMDLLKSSVGIVTGFLGMPAEALPMAIIRPLSGNGAFGYMSSVFSEYGPDSFLGQLVSVMQGSTETTLYVLAVYFGAVQVYRVRYALAAGLLADLSGIIAAVFFCRIFF